MASLNKVYLIGNLTRDPDLRYTNGGAAVCDLGLAVNRKFTSNGQEKSETCFIDISVWGKSAENCKRYLEKGSSIMVEGRLQLDTWEKQDGSGRNQKISVVAENIQFLRTASGSNENPNRNSGGNSAASDRYAYAPDIRQHDIDKGNAYQPQHEQDGVPW